ncbi:MULTISPECIES: hypothetical protein [unclassified Variovorax]|uniref:hypothetical protein n=1 Tax=unclassified Variovorax TaxID=663243 RepID=UPI001F0C07D3|nr:MULTISPECIES: hypothetical protein [unclassified Variovorax]
MGAGVVAGAAGAAAAGLLAAAAAGGCCAKAEIANAELAASRNSVFFKIAPQETARKHVHVVANVNSVARLTKQSLDV